MIFGPPDKIHVGLSSVTPTVPVLAAGTCTCDLSRDRTRVTDPRISIRMILYSGRKVEPGTSHYCHTSDERMSEREANV